MHEKNFELLRKEANRLIKMQGSVIKHLYGIDDLYAGSEDGVAGSLSRKDLEHFMEVLKGEHTKLINMDMVVAVVGTMKAGKSTTINAIVGSEVLPHRNAPMTSVPTLIRHTKGQVEPLMRLENNGPINEFLGQLRQQLSSSPTFRGELEERLDVDDSFLQLIDSSNHMKKVYKGRSEISSALRSLNDLVRAADLSDELDFPFKDYDEVHEFPVIEVEFSSFSDLHEGMGRLSLLDTPGPNEAGRPELKKMLSDQLKKASAVIAVLNYTNLQSESDHDLRNELLSIADVSKGRSYVFVNRYDQHNSATDEDVERLKRKVSKILLQGKVDKNDVFGVSALYSLSAQVASRYMKTHGSLVGMPRGAWLDTVMRAGFGELWDESDLSDSGRIEKSISKLWDRSYFDSPLTQVIASAYKNSVPLVLESASSKLSSFGERLSNFVEDRSVSLEKDVDELRLYIDHLRSDIDALENLRTEAKQSIQRLNSMLERDIGDECAKQTKSTASSVVEIFRTAKSDRENDISILIGSITKGFVGRGKYSEIIDKHKISEDEGTKSKDSVLESLKGKLNQMMADKENIEFDTREDVFAFYDDLQGMVNESLQSSSDKFSEIIDIYVSEFSDCVSKDVGGRAVSVIKGLHSRMAQDGFDVSFDATVGDGIETPSLADFKMSRVYEDEARRRTRLKDKDGFLEGAKRFFGDMLGQSWGKEKVVDEYHVYTLSVSDLQDTVVKITEEAFEAWKEEISLSVVQPLGESLNRYFDSLTSSIEAVRSDLVAGLSDKEKTQAQKDRIVEGLDSIRRRAKSSKFDAAELYDESFSARVS